jgi:stage II sporulation protein M
MVAKLISFSKLAYGMKKFNIYIAFLFLGVVLGVLFSNLFQHYYYTAWENWNGQFKLNLTSVQINGGDLLVYVIVEKLKAFVLLWVLSTTILGIPYIYIFCVYKGFTMGFLFCLVMQAYGVQAFLAFGAYYFPQCLIYIPVFLLTFAECKELSRQWGKDGPAGVLGKIKVLKRYVWTFAILLVLLVLGCLLEAYGNPMVLRNIIVPN